MDELAPQTEPMDAYEWRSAGGATLLRLEPDGPGGSSDSGWPASAMFHQPDLEQVLARRIAECPHIELRRGAEVTSLDIVGDEVRLHVSGVSGHGAEATAAWVVGCDADSTTRRLMDVAVIDQGYFYDWLVVDVVPERSEPWRPLNLQVCDPLRPTTAVSGGRGRRRWEFMRLPDETTEELSPPEAAWRLLAPWGVTPANATLERSALYRFAACSAERWRSGRVLLAGDAAHQMPPFAGQGLCSGLRDAANLAWKLDAVASGAAPPSLLDSYHRERGPQVAAETEFSIDLGRVICVPDPAEAAARDEAMAAAAALSGPIPLPPPPPLGPGILRRGDPHAGAASVQGIVGVGASRGRFDDLLGAAGRWVLLAWAYDPTAKLDVGAAHWLRDVGAVVAVVGPLGPVVDIEGTYSRWFAAVGVEAVLVRPDFALFGAGAASELNAIIDDARAALRGGFG